MRYARATSNTASSIKIRFIVLFNMAVFATAFHAVELTMPEKEAVKIDEVLPHPEEVITEIILTKEMKIEKFFDELSIDSSLINPKDIIHSIKPWEQYIIHFSELYGVDSDLVRSIIYAESKGDPYKISRAGALGLMQIMPSTAEITGISDLLDPEKNINAGVKYLAWLKKLHDEPRLLWAWNAGLTRLKKNILPGETKKFIVEVITVKSFFKDDNNFIQLVNVAQNQ
ncbi:MAG: transglycosylase SLT domain-containing protein [Candidatus Latescibacteria bacterium]|nr:transglycosylase SLT domain-containing protein [Candidatus Latescibacterota bacterium]